MRVAKQETSTTSTRSNRCKKIDEVLKDSGVVGGKRQGE